MGEQTVAFSCFHWGRAAPFGVPQADAPSPTAADKELGETNRKKGEKTTEIVMPTSWVDQVLAKLAELKASVSILHNELLELIGSQLKMDQLLRQEAVTYV